MFSFEFRNTIFVFNSIEDYDKAYRIMELIRDDESENLYDWLGLHLIHYKTIDVEPTELEGEYNA